jgi:predicted transcriptional regulator
MKFPLLIPQTRLFVVGRICGVTVQENQLAVLVEAVFFMPKDSIANIISPQTP